MSPPRTPVATRLRRLAVDTGPLRRHRDFRLLWTGELVSQTGTQIGLVAVFIQVFELTDSPAAAGAIGLAQLGPLILMTLLGGPLIDRFDRRRLLLLAAAGQAAASAVLLLGALAGRPPLALVFAAAGLAGGLGGFALSFRSATTPNTVPTPSCHPRSRSTRSCGRPDPPRAACSSAGPACRGPTASTSPASPL